MGVRPKGIDKSFIFLIIIYIISITFLSYNTVTNFTKCHKEYNRNKELNSELEKASGNYNLSVKLKNEVTKKIEDINNLDNSIKNLKTDVFNKAKDLEQNIINKKNNYKIAYLTFDDGPYYLTGEYLKVLKENQVKATFFTIGLNKDTCYDNKSQDCSIMYKKIVDGGHTIANHTYSHLIFNGLYSSADAFINQVKKQEELILNRTGAKTNILRMPGGSASAGRLKNEIINKLRENHYGWVDWTAIDGDGGGIANKGQAWNTFKGSINEDIEVVLFHDYNYTTLSILPDAIKYLRDNNYILLPLFYDSIKINK